MGLSGCIIQGWPRFLGNGITQAILNWAYITLMLKIGPFIGLL